MAQFDRFDIVEAHACYAHDYGDYARFARCQKVMHHIRPMLKTDNLSENAREIYEDLVHQKEDKASDEEERDEEYDEYLSMSSQQQQRYRAWKMAGEP